MLPPTMMDFHFLRPQWFLALLPLVVLLWMFWRRRFSRRSWGAVVDPALLPHVLIAEGTQRRAWPVLMLGLAGLLAITALAGPVWRQLEQPVFQRQSAMVILLDLSRSMDAQDVKPSRLARARQKLRDILERRREGQTALIAYAAEAFVVSPLTTDSKTIIDQLAGLSTELMPAQGSRPDRAIATARELLAQAGADHGAVLLVTDGIEAAAASGLEGALRALSADHHRLLVLGVGTSGGAPIPRDGGGFVKDSRGAIVLPKLDAPELANLARKGGGLFRPLSADDGDIDALLAEVDELAVTAPDTPAKDMKSDQWREEGPWLLLPLLALAALGFRRGYLVLAVVLVLPTPRSGYAMDWDSLWRRDDQQAQQALHNNEPGRAARLFQDPAWRAAAHYRNGNYQAALDDLEGLESAEAYYNRGNALARLNRLPEALSAYEEALKRDPSFADAAHNRDLVKRWMEQAQSPQGGDDGSGKDQDGAEGQKTGDSQQEAGENGGGQDQQEAPGDVGDSAAGDREQGSDGSTSRPEKADESEREASAGDPSHGDESAGKEFSRTEPEAGTGPASGNGEELRQGAADSEDGEKPDGMVARDELSQEQLESEQATEQWLRRIPDDPAGLWRRKFLYQYQQREQAQEDEEKPW